MGAVLPGALDRLDALMGVGRILQSNGHFRLVSVARHLDC